MPQSWVLSSALAVFCVRGARVNRRNSSITVAFQVMEASLYRRLAGTAGVWQVLHAGHSGAQHDCGTDDRRYDFGNRFSAASFWEGQDFCASALLGQFSGNSARRCGRGGGLRIAIAMFSALSAGRCFMRAAMAQPTTGIENR